MFCPIGSDLIANAILVYVLMLLRLWAFVDAEFLICPSCGPSAECFAKRNDAHISSISRKHQISAPAVQSFLRDVSTGSGSLRCIAK